MVTNVNQNRHLYVANKYNATVTDETVVSGVSKGIIGGVKVIGTGKDAELIFKYKGADNTLKSDRIQLNNLNYAKAIPASDMRVNLKSVKVALDSSINSGNPKTGQDYILRITFRHWIGMSELDQYVKDAAVHVTAAMEADKKKFYKAMVSALNLAFSREIGASKDSNPYLAFGAGVSGNEDGIYIVRCYDYEFIIGCHVGDTFKEEKYTMNFSDALETNLKNCGFIDDNLTLLEWLRNRNFKGVQYDHNYDLM